MSDEQLGKITELDWLRNLYLEDLGKMVNYGGVDRSRVAHVGKYRRLDNLIRCPANDGVPLDLNNLEDGRKVWIWSDQHFFHKNIISFSERPFDNVPQMNEHMIANYNEYVGEDDICLWVGDVGFGGNEAINEILSQCNGYKILIIGNHDFKGKNLRWIDFDETHLIYNLDWLDTNLVLTHYPMYNLEYPWVNIHGHLHIFPTPDTGLPLSINVNCEVQGYRPRLLDEVAVQAQQRLIAYIG